jgi:DNA-binding HxlR family transcriptional regulator
MADFGTCGCSTQTTVKEPVCLCSVTEFARLIGRRYTLALLATIGNAGPIRFGELRERVGGISPSTLAERLEELETTGLIKREVYAEVPPRVEYSLTSDGRALRERLRKLLPLVERPARAN